MQTEKGEGKLLNLVICYIAMSQKTESSYPLF